MMPDGLDFVFESPGHKEEPSTPPKIRPRRFHSKSRNGCFNCKHRRVKCDEARPSCLQCNDKALKCEYPPEQVPGRRKRQKSASIDGRGVKVGESQSPPHQTALDQLKGRDSCEQSMPNSPYTRDDTLQLVDHFTKHTFPLWLGGSLTQSILQAHALPLALNRPWLLHAILATSAAHLSYGEPDNKRYSTGATVHYQQSLTNFTAYLETPIPEHDADAVFATGLLHTILAFAKPTSLIAEDTPEEGRRFGWVPLFRGTCTLLQLPSIDVALRCGVWAPLTFNWDNIAVSGCDSTTDSIIHPQCQEEREQVRKLARICLSDPLPPIKRDVLEKTLTMMESLVEKVDQASSPTLLAKFFYFLSIAPQDAMKLWRHDDPKDLLVLGFWCAFISRIDQWWLTAPAKSECRNIRDYVASFQERRLDEPVSFLSRFC